MIELSPIYKGDPYIIVLPHEDMQDKATHHSM